MREELFKQLTTSTAFRDAVFSEKEVEKICEKFKSPCIETHKIKYWSSDVLVRELLTSYITEVLDT